MSPKADSGPVWENNRTSVGLMYWWCCGRYPSSWTVRGMGKRIGPGCLARWWWWLASLLAMLSLLSSTVAQDDFSEPITCFYCFDKAVNTSCSDPIIVKQTKIDTKKCAHGVCVKWTRYHRRELYIERTCSIELNFNIAMMSGVCRTERNGNGYLCMCGKHLCNTGSSRIASTPGGTTGLLLAVLCHVTLLLRLWIW